MACLKSKVMKVKLVMFERRKKNKQKASEQNNFFLTQFLIKFFKLKVSKIFEQQIHHGISLNYELLIV